MSDPTIAPQQLRRAVAQRSVQILVLSAIWLTLFFSTAGTVRIPAAWYYLAVTVLLGVVNFFIVVPRNPAVIVARSRTGQEGTKGFDRWFGLFFALTTMAIPVVAGLDAVRYGWSPLPGWTTWAGLGLVVLGNVPIVTAMAINPHLEKTVRIQTDRDHQVIQTGPYAIVRHPMYVGAGLQQVALPLVVGSAWAFVPAALVLVSLVVRTALEDRTLRAELAGYEDYAKHTRARLLPGVW